MLLTFSMAYSHAGNGLVTVTEIVNDEINPSSAWQEYATIDGVKIEYRIDTYFRHNKDQSFILLQFTNTTNQSLTCNWTNKLYYGGDCINCQNIDSHEYKHQVVLLPGQVVTGDNSNLDNESLNIFSHFVTIVPGMSTKKLTDFELLNFTAE